MATSKYKKSTKDLAFEREKVKLQARNLQLCRELAEARARNAELISYIEETTGCCPETFKKDIKNREMIAGLLNSLLRL